MNYIKILEFLYKYLTNITTLKILLGISLVGASLCLVNVFSGLAWAPGLCIYSAAAYLFYQSYLSIKSKEGNIVLLNQSND